MHAAVANQLTEESSSNESRRSSTSSKSSTDAIVEQIKRPILVRHDNVDTLISRANSIKKTVRIDEPVSSESSETEYSSEAGILL